MKTGLRLVVFASCVFGVCEQMSASKQSQTSQVRQTFHPEVFEKCNYNQYVGRTLVKEARYKSKYGELFVGKVVWPDFLKDAAYQDRMKTLGQELYEIMLTEDIRNKYQIVCRASFIQEMELVKANEVQKTSLCGTFLEHLVNIIRVHLLESSSSPLDQPDRTLFRLASDFCYTSWSEFVARNAVFSFKHEYMKKEEPLTYLNILGMAAIKLHSLQMVILYGGKPLNYSSVYKPSVESIVSYGKPKSNVISWAIRSAIADPETRKITNQNYPLLSWLE